MDNSYLILNIPHASDYMPQSESLGEEWYRRRKDEGLWMTDRYTDELFCNGFGIPVVAQVSRMLCDTERFEDDSKETMADIGMGVCYTKGHCLQDLGAVTPEHRERMLERHYRTHHVVLADAVGRSLERNGRALLLDCHSFSSRVLDYEPDRSRGRPDICIGTDSRHTSPELLALSRMYFSHAGLNVAVDTPYSGTMVPVEHMGDPRVGSVMVEINRSLYMDEASGAKRNTFGLVKGLIAGFEKMLLGD